MPKVDPVKELFSKVQTLRREAPTANKWRTQYIKDVGSMLTRYNIMKKRAEAAEAKLAE